MSSAHQEKMNIVATYSYENSEGDEVFQVVRLEPKGFRQRRRDPDNPRRWLWNVDDAPKVLYRLPEVDTALLSDETVYVVEGEKDADALAALGVAATCNAGGAGKWRAWHSKYLRGAVVVVIADRDKPGYKHARDVAGKLLGVAESVRLVEPAEGKDVSDHLEAGLTLDDLVDVTADEPSDGGNVDGSTRATWEELLARAIERASEEGRNNGCLWLVCQARDNRYAEDEARALLEKFQSRVDGEGEHSFRLSEAMEVFEKNFFTAPREPWRVSDLHRQPLTDYGNAERLVLRHGDDLRYVHAWNSWQVWDGTRWARDDNDEVQRLAKETIRALGRVAADEEDDERRNRLVAFAMKSEGAPRLAAMIDLAKSERPVPVAPDELDADPWLLNVANGVLHLGSGELLEHRREWLLTKLAPVAHNDDARCPMWHEFLKRVMPNEDDRAFLKRAVGYSMIGMTDEHILLVLYGTGANGKTVFLETVRSLLGDYAHVAPSDLLIARRPGAIPLEAAGLRGARFVSSAETEDGSRLAESAVKALTGGDTITARRLYGDFFSFTPTHTLWLATNHRPVVRGVDDAIWRRLRLIPFNVTIPEKERDKSLAGSLRDELPGILKWALEGALEWQRFGLGESGNIVDATNDYRAESDVFGMFLEDRCEVGARKQIEAVVLYSEYEVWASGEGLRAMSKIAFGRKMRERGFESVELGKHHAKFWRGVAPNPRRLRLVDGSGS
jgi:P4 family phage/plasmid primase-like protien